jgi:hypothetical protein
MKMQINFSKIRTSGIGQDGMDIRRARQKVGRRVLCRVSMTSGTFSAIWHDKIALKYIRI